MAVSSGRGFHLALAGLALMTISGVASAQVDQSRREIATPGLVLETGSRTSACDVLKFTNNGQYLLATGDDKVVRTWKFTPKGLETIPDPPPDPDKVPQGVLRWTSHRERRGNIYAAAVSPDAKGQYIAIGGTGIRNSQFAVLDRFTGQIVKAVPYISMDPKYDKRPKLGLVSIWSVAFSPLGDQVACGTGSGAVWMWDWKTTKAPVLVGEHELVKDAGQELEFNYVRFVAYHDKHLISADEHGRVYRWELSPTGSGSRTQIATFSNAEYPAIMIRFFALSPDGQWLAAAHEAKRLELRSLTGGEKIIDFVDGYVPNAVAFDRTGKRLAVSFREMDQQSAFAREKRFKVSVFDVDKIGKYSNTPAKSVVHEIHPRGRVEVVAFHPDGKHLATAGGDNHDIAVYTLGAPSSLLGRPMAGPGQCIWNVQISNDGRYLGFQTERKATPSAPNDRGAGPRKVFDLQRRLFTKDAEIDWAVRLEETPDWKLLFSKPGAEAKDKAADKWYVQSGKSTPLLIPWNTKIDEYPYCYAFIPSFGKHPERLVIGHGLYGVNVYDLTPDGPVRTRVLTGHDSGVVSLAVDKDGKRLVTASRDETIAGWSLEDWPSHPTLGAELFVKQGKLYIGAVDQGSPLWEAGLSTGDEVVFVYAGDKIRYNRGLVTPVGMTVKLKDSGSVPEALAALQKPDLPGSQVYFGWKRPGENTIREATTFVRDRPIWRFFPTKDDEWVLWRYLDFLYDTSTRGDSYIGWQRNMLNADDSFNVKGTPQFYRAEQFRKSYHNPDKVTQTLTNWSRTDQDKSTFVEIEPPQIEVLVNGAKGTKIDITPKDQSFVLSVKVTPSFRQNQALKQVAVWINDFQFKKWQDQELAKHLTMQKNAVGLTRGVFDIPNITIPADMLRNGPNRVFVQSYNMADVRGESERVQANNTRPRPKAIMHGLFIGVGNYKKALPYQIDLQAPQDADELAKCWDEHHGKGYAKAFLSVLKDAKVTAAKVLEEFDKLAAVVKPDDLLVFHLGGHGVSTRKMVGEVMAAVKNGKLPKEDVAKFKQELPGLGPFYFLCGDFDFLRIRDTTISLDDLYERMAKLPCHKVIMLDACNAAAVNPADRKGTDIIRLFTKDGVGPIIFAACKAEESAIEFPGFAIRPAAGLFAQAIIQTVEDDFAKSKRATLNADYLAENLGKVITEWVKELQQNPKNKGISQTPAVFLPDLERNFAILVGKDP